MATVAADVAGGAGCRRTGSRRGIARRASFLARAAEARPGFALTPENAEAIAEIGRRLDGIPLAIELAAARLRVLTPTMLVERLSHRLDLRSASVDLPERQRTLRSTLDWSYQLLDASGRSLLARLSVFACGWTLEASETVGAQGLPPPVDVLATLSSLVDNSLVTVDDNARSGPRFRMLGVVREYAAERLAERGEREEALDRPGCSGPRRRADAAAGLRMTFRVWAARLDDELDNVGAAWRHAIETDRAEIAYRLGVPLIYYFWSRSLLPELLSFLQELVVLPSPVRLDTASQGRLLWARAIIGMDLGHVDGVRWMLEDALGIGRRLDDTELVTLATIGLSYIVDVDELGPLRAVLEDGAAHFQRNGDPVNAAHTLASLGQLAMKTGDLNHVAAKYGQCLRIAGEVDHDHQQTLALHQLGFDDLIHADPARAREHFTASLAADRNLLDQEGLAYCLDGLAAVLQAEGRSEAAVQLYGAADKLHTVLGIGLWRVLQPLHDQAVDAVRSTLGTGPFERERASGSRLAPADALGLALQTPVER